MLLRESTVHESKINTNIVWRQYYPPCPRIKPKSVAIHMWSNDDYWWLERWFLVPIHIVARMFFQSNSNFVVYCVAKTCWSDRYRYDCFVRRIIKSNVLLGDQPRHVYPSGESGIFMFLLVDFVFPTWSSMIVTWFYINFRVVKMSAFHFSPCRVQLKYLCVEYTFSKVDLTDCHYQRFLRNYR